MTKKKPNPYFKFQQFTVYHDKCAMKVGTDGVLLGSWVDVEDTKSALDIGTGTGLISLMMAQRNSLLEVYGIDIDKNATIQAKENISLSPFANRISITHTSLQDYDETMKFDAIVSNPPYFNLSLKSPNEQRTLARHTDTLPTDELIKLGASLLSPLGKLSLIYPFEYKDRLIELAKDNKLFVSRITNVYPTPQAEAKRILIEISKELISLRETNLIIEMERHHYSPEFYKLTKDFYLNK